MGTAKKRGNGEGTIFKREINGKTDPNTVIVDVSNIPLSIKDRSSRQKIQ